MWRTILALGLVCCVGLSAAPAAGQADWNLALKSDEDIVAALRQLSAEAPGAEEAPAVQMLREAGWEVRPGERILYRNIVILVKDPEAVADIGSSFYLDARGSVESARAFVLSGGELRRPEVDILRGDGEVHRTRLGVDLQGLAAGDIVGFSSITRFENILYSDKVPMSARMPVAEFSLRVRCEQSHTYAISAVGPSPIDVVVVDRAEGRPVEWHATARGLAAVSEHEGGGVYRPGMALALVAEASEYVPATQAWMPTLAWPRVALFLSGLRESGVGKMIAIRERADEVLAGASTPAEKEEAIFGFVRDEFDLLIGEPYEPLGYRSAKDVLAAGEANPMEMAMLMVALLDAAGLPGELAVVRSDRWGPLREDFQSFAQFFDLAVRCGEEDARYYVPYVADAEAGVLPADWGLSWVIAPQPGLLQKVSQASSEMLSQPGADPHAVYGEVRERSAREGWYVLEQVQGGAR